MELTSDLPTLLIVPGMGNSGPDHWQTHLQNTFAGAHRIAMDDWLEFDCGAWVEALDKAIRSTTGQVIVAAHSAGVIAVVHWADQNMDAARIHGALLVAPADYETEREDSAPLDYITAAGWIPIPLMALPFRSILVASSDDPYTTIARSAHMARAWGSQFKDLGAHGHINVAAGFGQWPLAEQLIHKLQQPAQMERPD